MKILAIDTSGKTASVAISDGARLLWEKTVFTKLTHSQVILPMVENALEETGLDYPDIDCIAIANGPGSYTGLRIGVSMAKGICYARNLKLLAVPTLELLAVPVLLREQVEEDALICPMLDARRMEVYAGIFDRALHEVRPVSADVVDENTYKEYKKGQYND